MVNQILEALLEKQTPPRGVRAIGTARLGSEGAPEGYFIVFMIQ